MSKANRKQNNDRNQNFLDRTTYDLSKIRCYNCTKKGNYLSNCIKPIKKQVLVLATFTPVIEANKKGDDILDWVPCIYYLIQLKKNKV